MISYLPLTNESIETLTRSADQATTYESGLAICETMAYLADTINEQNERLVSALNGN